MARLIQPKYGAPPQNDGERRLIDFLLSRLPPSRPDCKHFVGWDEYGKHGPEFLLIPNAEYPDSSARFLEVDAILIAPHACYVIETKDWGPKIRGDDWGWILNDTRERPNPHKALNYKCRVIRSIVGKHSPDLMNRVWYQSLVVISRDQVDLQISGRFAETTHRLDEELVTFLRDSHRLSTPKKVEQNAIAQYQKELATILCGAGRGQTAEPLRIADYEVEEKLTETEGCVEYLARSRFGNKKSPLKRLRVFRVPYVADQKLRKEQQDRILRDYAALEAIGDHPNIVAFRGISDWESEQVVEVLDWSESGSLRRLMQTSTFTLEQRLAIVKGIAIGLKAAHAKGIIHRDLRPENVLMSDRGPQLMNFDRSFLSDSGQVTVWKQPTEDMDRRYLPPELCAPPGTAKAVSSSDLYSLGAIFYELLTGTIPYDAPEALQAAGGRLPPDSLPSRRVGGLPTWIDDVVEQLYTSDLGYRYKTADEFLFDFAEKMSRSPEPGTRKEPPQSLGESAEEPPPGVPMAPGTRVGDFRIVQFIHSGGFANVYEATHVLQDVAYALKVNNESVQLSSLISEFGMLSNLKHPNIVQVHWNGQLPNGRFYLAMELLKGESLREYVYGDQRMPAPEVLKVGHDILAALRYLHEPEQAKGQLTGKSLYHRDVKPENIIWVQNRGFVLIDFNISKEASRSKTFAGTSPYLAPDLIKGVHIDWDESGDLFALGVTLYELMTKRYPFSGQVAQLDEEPTDPRNFTDCENFSDDTCRFLMKACHTKRADRFKTAAEMEAALRELESKALFTPKAPPSAETPFALTADEIGKPNYNPFVRRLRRLYSQAKHNNVGTRGLDEVALSTYVSTKLDRELIPEILNGQHRLVLITGNAGDGKTAWIQQLEKQTGNSTPLPTKNGSRFQIKEVPFVSNYDGSQDEGSTQNDDVLESFLSPFYGMTDLTQAKEGRILAINEGRLVEFLGAPERKSQLGFLYEAVDKYFNERADSDLPPGLIVVNLNWRSVVAGSKDQASLMEMQFQALLKPEFWLPCDKCEHRDKCIIRHNAASLGDTAAGLTIRTRMAKLFEAVHLRRQMHTTMRHLRSTLAYLITRDLGCEDIPPLLGGQDRLKYASLAYWNISDSAANDSGNEERLIQLLRNIDVGKVSRPGMDRDMHFLSLAEMPLLEMANRTHDYPGALLLAEQKSVLDQIPGTAEPSVLDGIRRHHSMMVRKLYFEGRSAEADRRLPHGSMTFFNEVLEGKAGRVDDARRMIIHAVSLSEGCRNDRVSRENICIAANAEKDPRWHSFRLFPANDFEVYTPTIGKLGRYLEHAPDRFVLRHRKDIKIVLEVNLDMFELLSYVEKGFSPSMNDLQGRYVELIIFKNMLQHLPYRSVVLTENQQEFFRIQADAGNSLVLAKVE